MSDKTIENKVIVITGGATGIGYEITKHFLEKRAKTAIILDIDEGRGEETKNELNATYGANKTHFIKCDVVKDLETVSERIFKEYKQIDVLVNNAGIFKENDWKKTIDINIGAVIGWSDKFLAHMRKDKGGKGGVIVNIASIKGLIAESYAPMYTASKHAVVGFTRALGHEKNYVITGVRVIAVCPGYTKTTLTDFMEPYNIQSMSSYKEFYSSMEWQTIEDVGRGTVEVFERAETGTAWIIEGGKQIKPATFIY